MPLQFFLDFSWANDKQFHQRILCQRFHNGIEVEGDHIQK